MPEARAIEMPAQLQEHLGSGPNKSSISVAFYMMGFGMVFGAQLAIAASDEQAFCEHAEVERNPRDAKHLILDPPSPG